MHLSYKLFTVHSTLQGVDDVVIGVVLIVVQHAEVHIVFSPVWIEKVTIDVARVA